MTTTRGPALPVRPRADCRLPAAGRGPWAVAGPRSRFSAGPLRGKKGSVFEGGVREPCIMRWPGKVPANTTCNQIAGNIDVAMPIEKVGAMHREDIGTMMHDSDHMK